MASQTADELARLLVQLQLVSVPQIDALLADFSPGEATAEEFLQALEARNLLTSYQTAQLRKGETDALVVDGYKLLYRNASGSFARVFRAEGLSDGRMVALKLLRQRWVNDEKVVSQFRREALLCKRLHHRNIVPIYDVGQDGDNHFFTMQFVEGGNLRDFITIRKKLSPLEATRCLMDIAEGLQYALKQGITHRDLKLTNVLMGTDGVAKLVDFGLAGAEAAAGLANGETSQRALEYAALEKGTGAPDNDPRTDLFFAGAIYYELLSGVPPYARTRNRDERKRLSRYRDVRSLLNIDPGLPAPAVAIADRLMMLNPAERYQSPTELLQDLRSVLRQLDPEADRAGLASDKRDETTDAPTVLCIESRKKHQDVLRKYLSRHGFRVLLLGNLQRALQRVKTNPPDCVVLMEESTGKEAAAAYRQLADRSRREPFGCVLVLSQRQRHLQADCPTTPLAHVLVQPVTVRQLRKEIQSVLRERRPDVDAVIEDDSGSDDSAVARI